MTGLETLKNTCLQLFINVNLGNDNDFNYFLVLNDLFLEANQSCYFTWCDMI